MLFRSMRRYSAALPAFRSRLQNQIALSPLMNVEEAAALADFYVSSWRNDATRQRGKQGGAQELVTRPQVEESFEQLRKLAERRGDAGVKQREFLHQLHVLAEKAIQVP